METTVLLNHLSQVAGAPGRLENQRAPWSLHPTRLGLLGRNARAPSTPGRLGKTPCVCVHSSPRGTVGRPNTAVLWVMTGAVGPWAVSSALSVPGRLSQPL